MSYFCTFSRGNWLLQQKRYDAKKYMLDKMFCTYGFRLI
jgi:hypothetical protein